MSSESNAADRLYQLGIASFECGDYRASVSQFEQARGLVDTGTTRGGEIQVWLANAYDAMGRNEEAIALCRKLVKHPDRDVRKSARYVLGILTAPKLNKLKDVVSVIPNLDNWEIERDRGQATKSPTKLGNASMPNPAEPTESEAYSRNSLDERFLWVAAAIAILTLTIWAIA